MLLVRMSRPCNGVPCTRSDVHVFRLLMEPFTQEAVETDEEHFRVGAFRPTCMFQSKQGLASPCGALEQTSGVGLQLV